MPKAKFKVEGYFTVIVFPYLLSSLWVSQRGSCVSGEVRCCLLKCDLCHEMVWEAAGGSKSTSMEGGAGPTELGAKALGAFLWHVSQPKSASGCSPVTITGFGGGECLLWGEVRQDTCCLTSRAWGYLACRVILNSLFLFLSSVKTCS